MKDFLLEAFPNPERKGCPDESTLKALAADRLPKDHPARMHLGSCSECYAEYLHYKQDLAEAQLTAPADVHSTTEQRPKQLPNPVPPSEQRNHRLLPFALAASLIVACGGGLIAYRHEHASRSPQIQPASNTPVTAAVDLFNTGTLRGAGSEATPLQQVSLPAAVVHLTITLPRFSESGRYGVLVSKDKAGHQIIGSGTGEATDRGGKTIIHVTLDLRSAQPGSYFLATVRGSDNGTYYYPLKIN